MGSDGSDPTVGAVVIQSKLAAVDINAQKNVAVLSKTGAFTVKSAQEFILAATKAIWALTAQVFGIQNCMTLRGPSLSVSDVITTTISASGGIMGPQIPGPSPGGTLHYNHIGTLPNSGRDPGSLNAGELADLSAVTSGGSFATDFSTSPPTWNFQEQGTGPAAYESLSQQFLRLDAGSMAASYTTWNFSSNALQTNTRTGSTFPLATDSNQWLTLPSGVGADLRTPLSTQPTASATRLVTSATTFQFLQQT
jgi:hypothetical protein